jgi:hypothetical protein
VVYRAAVTNMCNCFEVGLADFIRSLPENQPKVDTCNKDESFTTKKERQRATHPTMSGDEGVANHVDEP